MRDKFEKSNFNNVSGNVFNGSTNIIAGNNDNERKTENEKNAIYTPEPIWRSPITLALLTWIGVILSLISVFPFYKVLEPLIDLLTKKSIKIDENYNNVYVVIFIVFMFFLTLIFWLRSIAKKQTRHPLFLNYAISGLGRKITIEKIYIEKCPKCGGKMKYYNKPVEWVDKHYSDGKTKREITKKVPVLQCKRNPEHWYEVDPAEDKLK